MNNKLLDKKSEHIRKRLIKAYLASQKTIVDECESLYLEMLEDGDLSYSRLMRYDRYYKLNALINKELRKLGLEEIGILDIGMRELYTEVAAAINPSVPILINSAIVEETINRVWCPDGKLWSDRIWTSKDKLQLTLQQSLTNCVIQGKSHKVLTKELKQRFGVANHEAERLARTELNYIQNQAAVRGYIEAGYTHYKFITAIDGRTCGECEKLNGQVFSFAEAQVGVNLPPCHSNCRSNIIGYKE